MNKEAIYSLYGEFRDAIKFCDEDCKAHGEEGFDVTREEINRKFATDICMMAFLTMAAKGSITQEEMDEFDKNFNEYGFGSPDSSPEELYEAVQKQEFYIPYTLVMLKLKSFFKILSASEEEREEVTKQELYILDTVLCIYADIMSSSAKPFTEVSKALALDCLVQCNQYIADNPQMADYVLSDRVFGVLYDALED